MPDNAQLGPRGEALAQEHLVSAGYRIVATNYACRGGEVDIVAQEGGDAVFVEVRTRSLGAYGSPSGTLDRAKWRRIRKAADHFLRGRGAPEVSRRYDVVSILWPHEGEPEVEIIRGVLPDEGFLPRKRGR